MTIWWMWRDEDEDAPGTESRKRCAISRKPRYRDGASGSSTREELEPDSLARTRRSGCADPDGDELEHDRAGRRKLVSSMFSIATFGLGTSTSLYMSNLYFYRTSLRQHESLVGGLGCVCVTSSRPFFFFGLSLLTSRFPIQLGINVTKSGFKWKQPPKNK
jgi:hypothetical protein